MGIFKAYDIRGKYPDELNEGNAYLIAGIICENFDFSSVVIGYDGRHSSPKIAELMSYAFLEKGKRVVIIGLSTTPMLYFATSKLDVDFGVMITASHNPKEYNGIKLCKKNAVPISYDTGIDEIERKYNEVENKKVDVDSVKERFFSESNEKLTKLSYVDIKDEYGSFMLKSLPKESSEGNLRKVRVAIDAGNGVGGFILTGIADKFDFIEYVPLFFDVDGDFPNHQANPLERDTLRDLARVVKDNKLDLGIAIDGDGDRIGVVDENGAFIQPDLLTAFFSEFFLSHGNNKGASIVYDLRSSKVVPEVVESLGARAIKSRVGHSYIKAIMRENNSIFAGELSGHFYFRFNDNLYFDSGIKALLTLLTIVAMRDKPFSELISIYKKYHQSGEINFEVKDKAKVIKSIQEYYVTNQSECKIETLDGLSVYCDKYWFNLRASNTENKLRLNLEANDKDLVDKYVSFVEGLIHKFGV